MGSSIHCANLLSTMNQDLHFTRRVSKLIGNKTFKHMKDINLTLIHCQDFHPFTQAKRKLATHEEEERKEK